MNICLFQRWPNSSHWIEHEGSNQRRSLALHVDPWTMPCGSLGIQWWKWWTRCQVEIVGQQIKSSIPRIADYSAMPQLWHRIQVHVPMWSMQLQVSAPLSPIKLKNINLILLPFVAQIIFTLQIEKSGKHSVLILSRINQCLFEQETKGR